MEGSAARWKSLTVGAPAAGPQLSRKLRRRAWLRANRLWLWGREKEGKKVKAHRFFATSAQW